MVSLVVSSLPVKMRRFVFCQLTRGYGLILASAVFKALYKCVYHHHHHYYYYYLTLGRYDPEGI